MLRRSVAKRHYQYELWWTALASHQNSACRHNLINSKPIRRRKNLLWGFKAMHAQEDLGEVINIPL
jgi:hypothetical protein